MATRSKPKPESPRRSFAARKVRSRRGRHARRRLGRVALLGAIAVAAAFLAYPFLLQWRLGGEFGARVAEARSRLNAMKRENTMLEADIRHLGTRIGLEETLREGGYRRNGELVFQVHSVAAPKPR